jgi:uncharacterized protein YdhG (YjbR/CyaY superfamily)
MRSEAADVAAYLAGVPAERRVALERLRALCVEVLKGHDEGMDYGMPCYRRDGLVRVAFASQKQYISLYVLQGEVVERYRAELGGSVGKSCIRFKGTAAMDFGLIRRVLKDTAESTAIPCA